MDPTSRVRVEYHDPCGINENFENELRSRLPLRELHWSPGSTRSARSISKLHIELASSPTTADQDESVLPNDGFPPKGEGPKKERRHQIPGLRRTPYLKICLLRSSDTDDYKANARKLLREWVNTQSNPSRSKQDNHDACEWLIVHVTSVSRDGSRPSGSIKSESIAEKRPNSRRWPSRSVTTIVEKIRADFNGVSKSAVDRVCQVEIPPSARNESQAGNRLSQDDLTGWNDLITKLKSLILASFDLRVSQYEKDLKERESQRHLPGWNFNTFFILKEGLARGFESVGLTEDALTGYHELALGLKAVMEEEYNEESVGKETVHFNDFTEELLEAFNRAGRIFEGTSHRIESQDLDLGNSILDTDRKPFQDLILTNKISAFDFQCYVFARQICLSLRLANATASLQVSTVSGHSCQTNGIIRDFDQGSSELNETGPEDLLLLAEITASSTEFLTAITSTVREDIKSAIRVSNEIQSARASEACKEGIIDNIVSGWVFSACRRILEVTSARSLSAQLDPLLRQLRSKASPGRQNAREQAANTINNIHGNDLPLRTSSLVTQGPIKPAPLAQDSFPLVTSLDAVRLLPPGTSRAGAQEIAAQRGDLLALARQVLSNLGQRHRGWAGGLTDAASVHSRYDTTLQDVEMNGETGLVETGGQTTTSETESAVSAGIRNQTLLPALISKDAFYALYEELTISSLACYVVGDRKKAAEAMTADLAVIRFHLADYTVAASLFRQLAPFYAKDDWFSLEIVMLDMHSECLRHLGIIEEYVRIRLRILAKIIRSAGSTLRMGSMRPIHIQQTIDRTQMKISDIIGISKSLDSPVTSPMDQFFGDIQLANCLIHSSSHDGFYMRLRMKSLLPDSLEAQTVKLKIVSARDETYSEIWLSADGTQIIRPGIVNIRLASKTMIPGWYTHHTVTIQCSKITLVHDLAPVPQSSLLTWSKESISLIPKPPVIPQFLIWPRSGSLEVRVLQHRKVKLGQARSIRVDIVSGTNNVSQGLLVLRAASAGLRLHTAEAIVVERSVTIVDKSHPGIIGFGEMSADSMASFQIPYDLEADLSDINVRAEVKYIDSQDSFLYACNAKISTGLPLAINVQDIFKSRSLYAKFTIGLASTIPVRVTDCYLQDGDYFTAEYFPLVGSELDIFYTQPLSIVSKIDHKPAGEIDLDTGKVSRRNLFLEIDYCCLDTQIYGAVEKVFAQSLLLTAFRTFYRLLKPALISGLTTKVGTLELEAIAVRRQFVLGSFDDHGWASTLAGLPTDQGEELATWLKSWHDNNKIITLDEETAKSQIQHLTIPVDIPQMQVLYTARLTPTVRSKEPTLEPYTLTIGHALHMYLTVDSTYDRYTKTTSAVNDLPLESYYEIQADPDRWLIGGQKKAHFSARDGERKVFALVLYPQTTGYLMYPSISVNLVSKESEILCDTNDETRAESFLVVQDRISTTVSLDPRSADTGWLVESRGSNP